MVTSVQSGTQAAVINTLHSLGTEITAEGTYVLKLNARNLVDGDALEIYAETKCISGNALETAYGPITYSHAQTDKNKYSIPIPQEGSSGILFKIKQTAGTGRSFDWNILKL